MAHHMLVQLAGLCVYSSWLSREVAPGGLDVEANRSDFFLFFQRRARYTSVP